MQDVEDRVKKEASEKCLLIIAASQEAELQGIILCKEETCSKVSFFKTKACFILELIVLSTETLLLFVNLFFCQFQ